MNHSMRPVAWLVLVALIGVSGGAALGRAALIARTTDSCQLTAIAERKPWTGWVWKLVCAKCADDTTGCEERSRADGSKFCACPGVEDPTYCTVMMSPFGPWPYCPSDGPCPIDKYCKKSVPPSNATHYECYCSDTPP